MLARDGDRWVLRPVEKSARRDWMVSDIGGAEEGELVLAEPAGRAVRVVERLGDPFAPRSFSLVAIHKHEIPHIFPDSVLEEADRSAERDLGDGREDLTHLPIVAIDPADARDHDDAIWAEPDDDPANAGGFKAVVAIADVSFYVRPGSDLDREAAKRGNSVYFPDRVVPMLPEVLSAGVCSLSEGEDRAALACHLTLAKDGRVRDHRFTRARVRIAATVAYEDAQAAIDGTAVHPLIDPLRRLWAAWGALKTARDAREPLDLDLPERRVVLDEAGSIVSVAARERLDAHRLVEDFMIAANVAAAKALEAKAAPVMYRVHEPPTREKADGAQGVSRQLRRALHAGSGDPAGDLQPGAGARRRRPDGEGADHHPGAAHPDGGLLRARQRRAFRAGAGLLRPLHLAHPPLRRLGCPPLAGQRIPARTRRIVGGRGCPLRAAGRADQCGRAPGDGGGARHGGPLRRRLPGRPGGPGDGGADHRRDQLRPVRHHRGAGRRRAAADPRPWGAEFFRHDAALHRLEGTDSGTTYALGDRLPLRLAEANPVSGGLRFALPDAPEGGGERRGRPDKHRGRPGKRGRPANIRHDAKRR